MPKYLLALDQGTTSSRSIVFDLSGRIIASSQREFPQIFPHRGWVEHDPEDIWNTQLAVAREALSKAGADAADIYGIGITNQRETTVVWERATGKPICNAIVWQCRRTAEYCDYIKSGELCEDIRRRTGLLIDAYFSATKLKWILDNVEGARKRARRGELCFGTVDSWLIFNLTGGKVHATDYSNASRTMLFNINTLEWDDELLRLFDIPRRMLPDVKPSSCIFGETAPELFGASIPVAGVAGDQQAALFGQCCFEDGSVKNTYGTGGFMLMNTGSRPVMSENGLLTTIAWGIGDSSVSYALEGSVFVCGAAVQWLRDGLGLISKASETETIARSVENSGGVWFIPAFVGLGAPYWDPYARGALLGLTRGTTRAHIVRAVLESMAYQTADVLELMEREAKVSMTSLKVDGGASANDLLLEIQADLLGTPIIRPGCIETTALGAANLAGLSTGAFSSLSEISASWQCERRFEPRISAEERLSRLDGWRKAVGRVLTR
ncbi:MAG: glycerol kinase GlpK [Eubacteriales bacterium]|nr:glycerol kinase GlpK [Clostridiales bacterium]MDY5860481.1 glycerol kinase GlpK [Eubacteriales bacterium]